MKKLFLTSTAALVLVSANAVAGVGFPPSSGMVYPGSGVANSTGSAWGTSYGVSGTGSIALTASPTLTGTVTGASSNWSGNVGIGTTSPASKLDVYGAIDISGVNGISYPADATTNGSINIGKGAGVAIGTTAQQVNSVAIGNSALANASGAATQSSAVGWQSLLNVTTGVNNNGFGWNACSNITTGNWNDCVGHDAGAGAGAATHDMTAMGEGALFANGAHATNLNYATAFGSSSLFNYTSTVGATAVGAFAGYTATTGYGTFLGTAVGSTTNQTNTAVLLIGTDNNTDTSTAGSSSHQLNIERGTITGTMGNGGTNPSICMIGAPCRLGHLTGANMNSTSDQAITINPMTSTSNGYMFTAVTKYMITEIDVGNCSASLTTAKGGFYTGASKTGTIIGATTTPFTNCTSSTTRQRLTGLTNEDTTILTAATINLSLTTAQGAAATADVDIYGVPYN